MIIFIFLSTFLEPDECSYDAYLPEFEKIVEHAEFILSPEVRDDGMPIDRNRFSFEMNMIQPLYSTALKCRNHALRCHAISLLHTSDQEGVRDGRMLIVVAKFIVEHEGQECVGMLSSETLDEKPVISLDVLDRNKGTVCVEYSKRGFQNVADTSRESTDLDGYKWIIQNKLLEQ